MAWRPGFCRYETWNGNWEGLRYRHTLFLADWYSILMDAMLEWSLRNFLWWFIGLSAILFNKDAISKYALCLHTDTDTKCLVLINFTTVIHTNFELFPGEELFLIVNGFELRRGRGFLTVCSVPGSVRISG